MPKKINKKKVAIAIIILLILILTIVFSILYRKNIHIRLFFDEYIFRKNIMENTLPKILNTTSNVFSFDDTIVVLENNVLTFYNKSADKVGTLDVEISNAIFTANDKYLCIAEKNGKKIYLISDKNIVWQKDIEGSISNLTINDNGYVAISISDTTYKTICKLYSDSGDELFTTYLSESYIMDFDISDDNKFLALAEANFSGIIIQSNVRIISIENALSNSTNSISYQYSAPADNLIVNINYIKDNNLLCIYNNHIDIVKNNSVKEITNFENTNILFADTNNFLIQVEKKSSGLLSSEFELQIIDTATSERKTYSLDKEPKSVQVFDKVIAINLGTEVIFIDNNAWLIKHYTASQEIQNIIISNDLAGIIFKDKIEFLSL